MHSSLSWLSTSSLKIGVATLPVGSILHNGNEDRQGTSANRTTFLSTLPRGTTIHALPRFLHRLRRHDRASRRCRRRHDRSIGAATRKGQKAGGGEGKGAPGFASGDMAIRPLQ